MKKNINYLYYLFVILLGACTSDDVVQSGSIHGVIKDFTTSKLLDNCIVTLNPTGTSLVTGIDGSFEFNNLDAGQYEVIVKREGYKDGKLAIKVTPGDKTPKDILLESKEINLKFTPDILDFGEINNEKELFISNEEANKTINYTVSANANWINYSPTEGIITNNNSKIKIVIDRSKLSLGSYEKTLTISSSIGNYVIPVRLKQIEKDIASISIGETDFVSEEMLKVNIIINSTGGLSITDFGVCLSESNSNPTIQNRKISLGDTREIGAYTATVSGLMAKKTYYLRAYAANSKGISYSDTKTIISPSYNFPTVLTLNATAITSTSAILHGKIDNDGGTSISECGFYYGTIQTQLDKKSVNNSSDKTLTLSLNDLESNKKYYFKAYATNSKGTSYGELLSFYTSSTLKLATLSNLNISNINSSYVTAQCSITDDGNSGISDCGFCYSKSGTPTVNNNKVSYGKTYGNIKKDIIGLSPNTKYYIRAYAINDVGTAYSDKVTFTTSKAADYLTTNGTNALLTFTSSGGTKAFTISSNVDWYISTSDSWITITPSSGAGDNTINVTVQTDDTRTARKGYLYIHYLNNKEIIDVLQDRANGM